MLYSPYTKLRNFDGILTVKRGDPAEIRLRSPHFYRRNIIKVC